MRDRLLLGCDRIEVGGRALVAQGRDRKTIPILCYRIGEPIEFRLQPPHIIRSPDGGPERVDGFNMGRRLKSADHVTGIAAGFVALVDLFL